MVEDLVKKLWIIYIFCSLQHSTVLTSGFDGWLGDQRVKPRAAADLSKLKHWVMSCMWLSQKRHMQAEDVKSEYTHTLCFRVPQNSVKY